MNLHKRLLKREAAGKPLLVGLIGAGKFCAMFLSQARRAPGVHMLGVVDLAPDRAREALAHVGWPEEQIAAPSLDEAAKGGTTWVGEDANALIAHLKAEHRMGRNYLKGPEGDRINAVLAAAGYNFSLLLRWLAELLCALIQALTPFSPSPQAG